MKPITKMAAVIVIGVLFAAPGTLRAEVVVSFTSAMQNGQNLLLGGTAEEGDVVITFEVSGNPGVPIFLVASEAVDSAGQLLTIVDYGLGEPDPNNANNVMWLFPTFTTFTYTVTVTESTPPGLIELFALAYDFNYDYGIGFAYFTTNTPPICDAGAPYAEECQGAVTTVALDGTGSSDADGDPLTYAWATDCPGGSFDDATSATPALSVDTPSACSLTCNVTLTVNDGFESDTCSTTVSIGDTSPPMIDICPVVTTVECDGAGNSAELNDWLGSFAASDICGGVALTDNYTALSDDCGATGAASVTFTATDDCDWATTCVSTFTIEDTTLPSITCPADTTLECPADTSIAANGSATGSDVCGSVEITSGDSTVPGCGETETITRTWTATDDCENSLSCDQIITVIDTTAPVLEIPGLLGDPLLVEVGYPVDFMAGFSESCGDVEATWDFGDTTGTVTDPATSPTFASHTYTVANIYSVTLTLTDRCGNWVQDNIFVVVYDPSDGFTTGGGWFVPDAESFIDGEPVTDTVSKANFGFVVKYKRGADSPDGNLQFRYKAGDINLHSLDMDWLVITSAHKVRFKGLASINGEGEYTFKVTAADNDDLGTEDTFKIEIWLGVVDTENDTPTPKHKAQGALGGGNIQVHH